MHRNILIIGRGTGSKSQEGIKAALLAMQIENRMHRQGHPEPVRTFYMGVDDNATDVLRTLQEKASKIMTDHWPHMVSEMIITHPYLDKPQIIPRTEFCTRESVIKALTKYKKLDYLVDATYYLSGNIHFSVVGTSGRIRILGKFINR